MTLKERGPMTNVHDWSEIAKFRDSFFFPEEDHVESSD